MTRRTGHQAFADVFAALVHEDQVGDILTQLVRDCAELLDADAVAILVRNGDRELTLLAATSHRAAELEMLQAQELRGPCVEVLETQTRTAATGHREMAARWGSVGRSIGAAGFEEVESYPMTWRGRTLGGLNVFRSRPLPSDHDLVLAQSFADIATIALIQTYDLSGEQIQARVYEALSARTLVEQAKGVLMHNERLNAEEAHSRLEQIARAQNLSLSRAARRLIASTAGTRPTAR